MKSLKDCLYDIGMGTCSLSGHCPYADAIRIARRCFSKDHTLDDDGLPVNFIEIPNWKEIIQTSMNIVEMDKHYHCACQHASKCKTKSKVRELIESWEFFNNNS